MEDFSELVREAIEGGDGLEEAMRKAAQQDGLPIGIVF